jgi:homocysteine S-methyltransferase
MENMPTPASKTRAAEFREALPHRIFVADGAMATMLFAKGVPFHRSTDELNLSLPALVRDVHREYLAAGAEILETNTFGANRARLAGFGFEQKVKRINQAGVHIARAAANGQAFVAGAVGPTGLALEPLGTASFDQARAIFREQIAALAGAGVDLLILETFRDLEELRAAVEAAREAAGSEIVIVAQVSFGEDGRLADGALPQDAARRISEMPVDVAGANCGSGPKSLGDAFFTMAQATGKPLSAMPSAGLPSQSGGALAFPCSPQYLATYARRFVEAGASIVGGCCGTTPDHVREMKGALEGLAPAPRVSVAVVEASAAPIPVDPPLAAQRSHLGAKLAAGEWVALVEIPPPRSLNDAPELAWARQWKGLVVVPQTSDSRVAAPAACRLFRDEAGVEPLLATPLEGGPSAARRLLLTAYACGVRNLLYTGGDPGGLRAADRLNRGSELGGGAFLIGIEGEEPREGCDYMVSPPVFDAGALEPIVERAKAAGVPCIATVRPLVGMRDAEYVVNELGIPVPEELLERMRQAETRQEERAEGIAIARELIERIRVIAAGVRLLAVSGDPSAAIEAAAAAGSHRA